MPLPPPRLIQQLERLGLADADDMRRSDRRAKRLARDLPLFESVWIDALVQCRVLTPYQGAELVAGRGDRLAIGPVVIDDRLPTVGYAQRFRARRRDDGTPVQLAVYEARSPDEAEQKAAILRGCVSKCKGIESHYVAPMVDVGCMTTRVWAVCDDIRGRPLDEIVARSGRLPAGEVLEIARQMVVGLLVLNGHGVVHGDISARHAWLDAEGRVVLMWPGLRGILLPSETRDWADLPPAAYDYLAPERIAQGTAPTWAADAYSCGCLWWHLLAGRPPFPGGSRMSKLAAVQQASAPDIRRFAPEAPAELLRAIDWCMRRDAHKRPHRPAELVSLLGPPMIERQAIVGRRFWRGAARRIPRLQHRLQAVRSTVASRNDRLRHRTFRSSSWLWLAAAISGIALWSGAAWWRAEQNTSPPLLQIAEPRVANTRPKALATAEVLTQNGRGSEEANTRLDNSVNDGALSEETRRDGRREGPSRHAVERVERAKWAVRFDGLPGNRRASHEAEHATTHAASIDTLQTGTGPVLELPGNRPVSADSLSFRAGHVVRAREGQRATVLVDQDGMIVTADNLTFRDVDFVWQAATSNRRTRLSDADADAPSSGTTVGSDAADQTLGSTGGEAARSTMRGLIMRLAAPNARFHNCSFTVPDEGTEVTGIRWYAAVREQDKRLSLATWTLEFSNCVFRRMAVAIECGQGAARRVVMNNCLQQEGRSLVRLTTAPAVDEPVTLELTDCTLRNVAAMLESDALPATPTRPGALRIRWTDCVFALQSGGAILRLDRKSAFHRWPEAIVCDGQGSVVTPNVRVLGWKDSVAAADERNTRTASERDRAASVAKAAEDAIHVSGLVQSHVDFAGPADSDPNNSRAVNCQAPRLSDKPPGIASLRFSRTQAAAP